MDKSLIIKAVIAVLVIGAICGGIYFKNHKSPCTLVEVVEGARRYFEQKKENEKKANEYYRKAIQYALENNLNIEDLDQRQTIRCINEHAGQKWMDETYPPGTEVDISCCSECSSYTMGNHRCDCGNSRISAYPEGDFINGFWLHTERH